MLTIQNLRYLHPDQEVLFEGLNLSLTKQDKIALIGNNGSGKSTLLKLMAGVLQLADGNIRADSQPYYVPQHFGQYNAQTVAEALRVDAKIAALRAILGGEVTAQTLDALNEDWGIEERCREALDRWGLKGITPEQTLANLSGGQKTKLFLAGIDIHQPDIVLLDEPTNHMDASGREMLYDYVAHTANTLVVVSHDRTLLNIPTTTYELSRDGIAIYGGNYDFYAEQKAIEAAALGHKLSAREKELRKAKETARETMARQHKLDARGRKKQDKAGVATIMLNTMRNNAENSTARSKEVHAEKMGAIAADIAELRKELPEKDKIKLGFSDSTLHRGKLLISAKNVNHTWHDTPLWTEPLNIELLSGARIAIKGNNGSGKTTLIRMMLGDLQPSTGTLYRAVEHSVYIDQDYSLINLRLTVFAQALQYNTALLSEAEVKSRLTHFLFTKDSWDKACSVLSGGEKMRLLLCCLTLANVAPDMIILDEPTNNLDIRNIDILTAAVNDYRGTLVVVSHDTRFLEELGVEAVIEL